MTKQSHSCLNPKSYSTFFATITLQRMPWQTWGPPYLKVISVLTKNPLTPNSFPNGLSGLLFPLSRQVVFPLSTSQSVLCFPLMFFRRNPPPFTLSLHLFYFLLPLPFSLHLLLFSFPSYFLTHLPYPSLHPSSPSHRFAPSSHSWLPPRAPYWRVFSLNVLSCIFSYPHRMDLTQPASFLGLRRIYGSPPPG